MEELFKKVQELNTLVKAMKMSPNTPKIPKPDMPAQQYEVPNTGPTSKKDPVKVAQQIKDGKVRENNIKTAKENKGKLNMNRLGQWSLSSGGKV